MIVFYKEKQINVKLQAFNIFIKI